MKVKELQNLDYRLLREIVKLYTNNPLEHVYLLYDIIYEPDNTSIYFALDKGIEGYLLIWRGQYVYGIHIWGEAKELITYIPHKYRAIIQVYNRKLLNPIIKYFNAKNVEVKEYLDMVVDEYSFKPYMPEKARRLREEDLEAFLKLKEIQGRKLDVETCRRIISRWRYYGVFTNGELVSIACAYIRMPRVWIIGDVFTHPNYRGRGYAKIVTSAITRDAIISGAKALLHVERNNMPAIKVYKILGYKVVNTKPWIIVS